MAAACSPFSCISQPLQKRFSLSFSRSSSDSTARLSFAAPRCFLLDQCSKQNGPNRSRANFEQFGMPDHESSPSLIFDKHKEEAVRTKQEDGSDNEEVESKHGSRMSRVCDKLIDVFMVEKTKPQEWRKLIAFSKEWKNIKMHFYERCKTRAQLETDDRIKGNLLKLARKLKEVDEDMERHNNLLAFVAENENNMDTMVVKHRKDFTNDFFEHLGLLYQANYNNTDEQCRLASVMEKCNAAVATYDKAVEEDVALSFAQMKLNDILNAPSIDAACAKIDDLAKRNEFDSTMMLLITKAWAASKESNMMKEEVKDILHHLYMVARGNMQRLVPKEVRIMRHVLSLDDPKEQSLALTEAFSPGPEVEGKDVDLLYTTPQVLHDWVNIVLDTYYNKKTSGLLQSVRQLMNPVIIHRLEALKKLIEDQFM